jgi:hypothetical protein
MLLGLQAIPAAREAWATYVAAKLADGVRWPESPQRANVITLNERQETQHLAPHTHART